MGNAAKDLVKNDFPKSLSFVKPFVLSPSATLRANGKILLDPVSGSY